jgi:hypothetical protein
MSVSHELQLGLGWPLVEVLIMLIELHNFEPARPPPIFRAVSSRTEHVLDLARGQEPLFLQPDKAALEPIRAPQALNKREAKRLAGARAPPALIEHFRHFGLAVFVQQALVLLPHLLRRPLHPLHLHRHLLHPLRLWFHLLELVV